MLTTYLENPIPALLKEKILARLSRYCVVPYSLVCHSCVLHKLGCPSTAILDLLEEPLQIVWPLQQIRRQKKPFASWEEAQEALGEALIFASECVYLRCREAASFHVEMRRLVGEKAYNHWVALVAYVETSHRWAEAHPEIRHGDDPRVREQFGSLLTEQPFLGVFFEHYGTLIARERNHRRWGKIEREDVRRVLEEAPRTMPDRRLKRHFQRWAKAAAVLGALGGGIGFLQGILHLPFLHGWVPLSVEMRANSGLGFLLANIALWLWVSRPLSHRRRVAARILGAAVCLIGAATLFEYFTGVNPGIDQWFVYPRTGVLPDALGRMSPYTTLGLSCFGLALVLLDRIFFRCMRPAEYLALLGGGVGFLTLLGYAYGVNLYHSPVDYIQMSLPAAILSVLLASGILSARPKGGLISVFVSATTAGQLMRRMLLWLGIVPAVLGWVGLLGQWQGWYGTEFGSALVVGSNMALFGALALGLGMTLLRAEQRRRKAERLLLEREADFRATFDQAAVGMAHIAPSGQWLRVNDKLCQIVGYSREELMERTFQDITAPEDQEVSLQYSRRLLRGEVRQYNLEKRYVRKNGSLIWANTSVALLREALGRPGYAIVVVQDISVRKRTEEELAAASLAKDRLISVISHELRTPLTPVLAALSSTLLDSATPEHRSMLEMMRRNIEHEVCLIDDLLDLTRLRNGKLRLNFAPVDLHALIQEVFTSLRPTLASKGIEGRLALNAPRHTVHGDSARLRQVLLNLLDNAIKFTPGGGSIRIETAQQTDAKNGGRERIVTRVSDTGAGIDPANLRRIFEAFEQGEQSIQRRYGGLGLGLAITKGLMEAHSGTLAAESLGPGRGSVFVFGLFTMDQPVPSPKPPAKTMPVHAHILLVEDHEDTRVTLQRLLEHRGHEVQTATGVANAIAASTRETFDIVVSDIGLPDGSGLEILDAVAASGRPVPGIALSGFGSDEDVRLSTQHGFVRHLTKPVDMEVLNDAISEIMVRQSEIART